MPARVYNNYYMSRIICSVCQRYYESKTDLNFRGFGEVDNPVSHGICAHCNILYYYNIYDTKEERKQVIKEELDKGLIWEGEDKSNFKPEQQMEYNKLFAEVKAERGEGNIDHR